MNNKVWFYQNNPCVIVRDVNEQFAEIQLSHHFADDMELTGQCIGCNVGDSDNKLMSNIKEYYTVVLTNIGNLDSRYRSSSELHEKNELQELSGRLQCKTISPEFNRYLIKRFK